MRIYSVGELTKYIKTLLEGDAALRSVMLRGEISNFKRHYSGHCYFTLKDGGAVIRAVMFKSRAQQLKMEPENGMKVVAGGYVALYERDGQYQLYVERLLPEGAGELSLAFEQLKERLAAEGLFDAGRKRNPPFLPRRIGVATSPTGAVIRDIITVAKRRFRGVSICLLPVQVQGEEAPPQIARALDFFNERYPVDVIIVGRGGGSLEDLWAFNDERVVRAISRSAIPVIAAVGHETDFTLADFAADVRAATPSQAAELAVPDARELWRRIGALTERLEICGRTALARRRERLERCLASPALTQPSQLLDSRRQRADQAWRELDRAARRELVSKRHAAGVLVEKLRALSPLAVLARGYAIVESGGRAVRSVRDVRPGELLNIRVADGAIEARATELKEG